MSFQEPYFKCLSMYVPGLLVPFFQYIYAEDALEILHSALVGLEGKILQYFCLFLQ